MSNFKYSMLAVACATAFFSTNSMARTVTLTNGTGNAIQIGVTNVAEGALPNASGWGSIAIGLNGAVASEYVSVALGQNANASVQEGVALGAGSVADRKNGTFGVDSDGNSLTEAVSFNGETMSGLNWVSGAGAVSIGGNKVDGGSQFTRQLTGLAAGSADTDAVNVAQLKSLKAYSDATFSTASNTIFGEGASNVITPAVPDNPDTTDVDETEAAATATNAAILGNNGKVLVNNGAAFGYNAQVMADAPVGSVAIGANSVASMVGRTVTSPYVPGGATMETSNAWASEGLVSFGYTEKKGEGEGATYVTHNRTLTGVAAGSEDNDAVNVAQLKQLENNTATQLSDLMSGKQQVSEIQLLARDELGNPIVNADGKSETIGLRYQVAAAEPAALADGDSGTATQSQGRLIYNNLDATGTVIGTETVATLNDGITISAGSPSSAAREGEAAPVKVDLNKGISFLTEEGSYLSVNVASDNNNGAVVTFGTTQALKDALANAGGNTGGNTGGDSGNSGNTGGSGWTPSQAQLAAMNGNFANGITVAPGEGNQAIQIKQGNVDMGGNRIQNVGNPINDGDAANKAYVDSTSRSLRNKINDVDKDLRAGVAMAMAVGGLPQAYMPGKSIVGVSAGTYHGQGGFALGLSHATDNRQWVFKGAASVDTRGNFGGQLSAGYQF